MFNNPSRIFSFGAGLVMGGIVAIAWLLNYEFSGATWTEFNFLKNSPMRAVSHNSTPADTSGTVEVKDQKAGKSAVVDSVTVPPPGVWVAVRELNGDVLGNVLGAVRVHGPQSNVVVPLLRATDPNDRYAIQLYRDDGDDKFDTEKDSVYVDYDTGARVVTFFKTTP